MQQQIAIITLGVSDLARSKRFYVDGFGWKPVFENTEIVFYQMNGMVFGTWLENALANDAQTPITKSGGFSLAHNVPAREEVETTLDHLAGFGGKILRPADDAPHGGRRGYIADPDGHTWEIAWNPAWPIDDKGHVTFAM